ncbi:MAG TPA: ATPase, partial [Sulfitobacter sp.]|nr:ATPase [Sulfitobacter sp.]
VTVTAQESRPVSDLPMKFWTQIFVAFVGMFIGTWVVCLRPHEQAGWWFLLSGIGLALASSSAAIYSSRELALSLTAYSVACRVNPGGSLL